MDIFHYFLISDEKPFLATQFATIKSIGLFNQLNLCICSFSNIVFAIALLRFYYFRLPVVLCSLVVGYMNKWLLVLVELFILLRLQLSYLRPSKDELDQAFLIGGYSRENRQLRPQVVDSLETFILFELPTQFLFQNVRSVRDASTHQPFQYSDLEEKICTPDQLHPKPETSALVFGKYFTDHMLEVSWDSEKGWAKPIISPMHNLQLHPGAKVLHYAIELFEGMKAYRGEDGRLRLFRPDRNMARMLNTAKRSSLPTFDASEMIKCIKRLIQIDKEWIPHSTTSSLYIRPTFIATDPSLGVASPNQALLYVLLCPVGPYFTSGFKPISLLADPQYVRSWPGGCGAMKMGANYAPTIYIQKQSELLGHQQVLWLYGADHQLTEVGTMNIFLFMVNKDGERELVTPPLDGLILPGVTRLSLLELAREWKEFRVVERTVTMAEVIEAHEENRLLEIFGAGTACVVCPIASISYQGRAFNLPPAESSLSQRFFKTMSDIHYGRLRHPWAVDIE